MVVRQRRNGRQAIMGRRGHAVPFPSSASGKVVASLQRLFVDRTELGIMGADHAPQRFLQAQGYAKVQNLVGGMLRWSDEVDSSKAKY